MTEQENTYALDDRALVRVTGEEALPFLQNLVTNDMRQVSDARMRYACLLTPQGQFLHEFFVLQDGDGGYFLDCDAAGRDDLARRLSLYKLRARVSIAAAEGWKVYACTTPTGSEARIYPDPRLKELGFRFYTMDKQAAVSAQGYDDLCISLCVPPVRATKAGKDFVTNLNLDLLHAVDWDKGCFVGQELTARMHYRALVKKRLLIVEGAGLEAGDMLVRGDVEMGEVRAVDGRGGRGLALLKLEILENPEIPLLISKKGAVIVRNPPYSLI